MNRKLLLAAALCSTPLLHGQNLHYSLGAAGVNTLTLSTNPSYEAVNLFVVALETVGASGGDRINFTFSSDYTFNLIDAPEDWFYTESGNGSETTVTWKYGGTSDANDSEIYDFGDGWDTQFSFLPAEGETITAPQINLEVNSFLRVVGAVDFTFNDLENFNVDVSAIPEPRHASLIALSLIVSAFVYRRFVKQS